MIVTAETHRQNAAALRRIAAHLRARGTRDANGNVPQAYERLAAWAEEKAKEGQA